MLKAGSQCRIEFENMKNVVIIFACLFAGALAQMECPPPDEHANATYFADPEDCHSYYECDNGLPVHVTCPDDLVWNQGLQACDFEWSTPCSTGTTTPPPPKESHLYVHAEELPTCPPPDPTGHGNVTFFPDETDCHKYYECDNGKLLNGSCPDGLVWSQDLNACDHEWSTPCSTERRHHMAPPLPITRKAAGRRPAPYTEKSFKLRQKLRDMQRARRHFIHKL